MATGRRDVEGKALEDEVRAAGGDLTFVRADVTDESDCAAVAAAAIDTYGRIDVLICNAGIVNEPAIVDTHLATLQWWNEIVSTNLTGTFLSCRAVLPQMISQNSGLILTISSINSQVPVSGMAAYNSSKAAVAQFTRTIAVEYMMHGLRANTVILGGAQGETKDAVHNAMMARADSAIDREAMRAHKAVFDQVLCESPEHVGAALAALASDDLATMSGASINLDRCLAAGVLTDMALTRVLTGQWSLI